MTNADIVPLIGYFLGAFGVGFALGALIRIFKVAASKIR